MKRPQRGATLSSTYYMQQMTKAFLTNNRIENNDDDDVDVEQENKQKPYKFNKKDNPFVKKRTDFKNKYEYQYHLDKTESIKAVRAMITHLKVEDDEKRVKNIFNN